MPESKSSLINLKKLKKNQIDKLFFEALDLKKNFQQHGLSAGVYHSGYRGTAALLFFEPSTRTRFSFEAASSRAGYHPLILDGGVGTSLEKGETVEDTIFNIQAMRPLFFVIRCNDAVDLEKIESKLEVPVLNAGWGRRGHPTQALLDALTIYEKCGDLTGKKILFVGDIKHSRVVASHIELHEVLGYRVGVCAPSELIGDKAQTPRFEFFDKLDEALKWADVVIALRVQKERHDNDNLFFTEDYREHYGLNQKRMRLLKDTALVMHPGPVNYGVEIEADILADKRCMILKQVENGVFLREALIRSIFDSLKNHEG